MTTPTPSQPIGAVADAATVPDFRQLGPDTYVAALRVSEPNTPAERLQRAILGSPIPETLSSRERLNGFRALAILSSDGLSSVAYGTEASLAVLVVAGVTSLSSNLLIGLVTAALMLIVGASYRQTIFAYPNGGGSYIVARANLGTLPGLIAAASLLVDYLLTVSVSVAAGVDALASAIPAIGPAILWIDLGAILLITVINLRGLRESGTIFALPTYLFLGSFGLMIVVGIVRALTQGGLTTAAIPFATVSPPITPISPVALTPLLILTAFASGCSAMTGIEAISNGVPAFEGATPQARSKLAAGTLTVMIALLASFFLGTTYLAWRVGAVPSPTGSPTITAQIARFAFTGGFGWFFYVTQIATLLILIFAANTSFNGFPRLLAILSRDTFAPAIFSYRGERLAYSVGILVLGALSAILLWIFQGNVTSLINLYALGVFAAFTLSQAGMVVHWLRRRNEAGWQGRIIANGIGAAATAVVTLVIAVAKFDRGAWVVLVIVPVLVIGFLGSRHYYQRQRIVRLDGVGPTPQADVALVPIFSHQPPPIEHLVQHDIQRSRQQSQRAAQLLAAQHPTPTTDQDDPQTGDQSAEQADDLPDSGRPNPRTLSWPQVVAQELDFALRIAPHITLLHVVLDEQEGEFVRKAWRHYLASLDGQSPERVAQLAQIEIEVLVSPYRTIVRPTANFIRWQQRTIYANKRLAVLLPRQLNPAWWEWPLQRRIARRVRQKLQGDPNLKIIDIPYTLGHTLPGASSNAPTDDPQADAAKNAASGAAAAAAQNAASASAAASDASDTGDAGDAGDAASGAADTGDAASDSPEAAQGQASGEESLGE